ncbi:MAG: hypothetical protein PVH74_11575 [Desulfobacterales bacterium]|jgi:hypothetical protein
MMIALPVFLFKEGLPSTDRNSAPPAPGWRFRIGIFFFVASFFILGGDFWDKFRALFIYEAKAQIPKRKSG